MTLRAVVILCVPFEEYAYIVSFLGALLVCLSACFFAEKKEKKNRMKVS